MQTMRSQQREVNSEKSAVRSQQGEVRSNSWTLLDASRTHPKPLGMDQSLKWLDYNLNNPGFDSWQWQQIYLVLKTSKQCRGPLSYLSNRYRGVPTTVVRAAGPLADHSPPPDTKNKNDYSSTSTPATIYAFMACSTGPALPLQISDQLQFW
jgi:hypothetical protein